MLTYFKASWDVFPLLTAVSLSGLLISGLLLFNRLRHIQTLNDLAVGGNLWIAALIPILERSLGRVFFIVWWLNLCHTMMDISMGSFNGAVAISPFVSLSALDVIAIFFTGSINALTYVVCFICEMYGKREQGR